MHKRLEYSDDRSNKFWEIRVEDASHTVTYGRIGTAGQSKAKTFGSAQEALQDAEKLILSKTKKGYREAGAQASVVAKDPAPAKTKAKQKAKKKVTQPAAAPWIVERQVVDIPTCQPSVAVSPQGRISLAWCGNEGVIHRVFDGGSWRQEAISDQLAVQVRLAYDQKGGLHAVFDRGSQSGNYSKKGIIIYARFDGAWKPEEVATGLWEWAGPVLPLVIDDSGEPHLAYVSNEAAFYVFRDKGAWKVERVGPARFFDIDLAVTPDGRPHLIYTQDMFLRYSTRPAEAGAKWSHEKVGEKYEYDFPALALGPDGSLHAAYMGGTRSNDRAVYVRRTEQGWSQPETAERKGNNGFGNRLKVAPDGTVYLLYRVQKSRANASATSMVAAQHHLAVRRDDTWQVDEIVAEGGWACDLALDAEGSPWVALASTMRGGLSLANRKQQTLAPEEQPVEKPREKNWYQLKMEKLENLLRTQKKLYLEEWYSADDGKFWEITVVGSTHTTRFGKVGKKGQSRTKEFDSPEKALNDAWNRADDKTFAYDLPEEARKQAEKAQESIEEERQAYAAEEEEEAAQAEAATDKPSIWDLRDEAGPLLGRLRGVPARKELREGHDLIYAEPEDPHFVLQRPAPAEWPDVLTNAEHLPVVSPTLQTTLKKVHPKLKFWPVRIEDASGQKIEKEYSIAILLAEEACIDAKAEYVGGGYYFDKLTSPRYKKVEAPAPLFWARYTFGIAVTPQAAAAIQAGGFSGVRLIPISDYTGPVWPQGESTYELLSAGTEGANLELANDDAADQAKAGREVKASRLTASMQPPKSAKRLVDCMEASGCLLVNDRVKKILDDAGAQGIQYLPVSIKDHAGQVRPEGYHLVNVLATCDYVDMEESSFEDDDGISTVWELTVDEEALPADPPVLFRLDRAEYAWYFLRRDVADLLRGAKIKGWRGEPTMDLAYSKEEVRSL